MNELARKVFWRCGKSELHVVRHCNSIHFLKISSTSMLNFERQYSSKGKGFTELLKYTRITPFYAAVQAPFCTASQRPHIPVMAEEVIDHLAPSGNKVFLDLTFGAGGHSRRILESAPGIRLFCLDRDPVAFGYATELQKEYPQRVIPLLGKFSDIPKHFSMLRVRKNTIDGVLMDLGVSSMQFDNAERGFMLSKNGPLDMRMDSDRDPQQLSAADILMHIEEGYLYKVLKYYGEEKNARRIARALVESRHLFKNIRTTQELAEFVLSLNPEQVRLDKLGKFSHPATKIFQAIRILVNNELNELDYGLQLAHYYLCQGGVLVAISFHSLEDTIIKRHLQGVDIDIIPSTIGSGICKHRTAVTTYTDEEMKDWMKKAWISLNKHVILPSEKEVRCNPRARSAKLRAAVKA